MKFQLANGVIKNFPLLARVNQALGITGGDDKDTKFDSFSASAAIGGGKAQTNDLLLKAGELSMAGAGTFGFDQSLNFKLQTILSAAKAQQLEAKFGLGKLTSSKGDVTIPITVTGTTTAPKYSVDIQSVAKKEATKQAQQQIQNGLMKLFKKDS
jgi:AsmA protein